MSKWTETEEEILTNLYNSDNAEKLAKELGRSKQAVKTRACKLGLTEEAEDEWTQTEEKKIKVEYPIKPSSRIAEELGRTKEAVKTKAKNLGVRKEDYHLTKYRITREEPETYRKTPESRFMAGLAAGEGCFTKNSDKEQFFFRIEMAKRDKELLEKFKETLGAGSIQTRSREKEEHSDAARLTITQTSDLVNKVIPFFEQVGLEESYKESQFNAWKKDLIKTFELEEVIDFHYDIPEGIRDPDFESEMESEEE